MWSPKYCYSVLGGDVGRYAAKIIYEVTERFGFEVVELAVMPDHVHMFVSTVPFIAPVKLVQIVKNITAR